MTKDSKYLFFVHKTDPNFRLVVLKDAPFPAESSIGNWVHTRTRTAEDTSPDVIAAIEDMGYCLFRIGFRFDQFDPL